MSPLPKVHSDERFVEIMTDNRVYISSPAATGGLGVRFETHVAAIFTTLMLARGFVPCLPCVPIRRIELQTGRLGYKTDDILVVCGPNEASTARLLCQVKQGVRFQKSNAECQKTLAAAWMDFNAPEIFHHGRDALAVVTGPLTRSDMSVRRLLEVARTSSDADEFLAKVHTERFRSETERKKLAVIRDHLNAAAGRRVADEELFEFLCHFHLLSYDVDVQSGLAHALMHTVIGSKPGQLPDHVWSKVLATVESYKGHGGTLCPERLSDLCRLFGVKVNEYTATPQFQAMGSRHTYIESRVVSIAAALGAWSETNLADRRIVSELWHGDEDEFYGALRAMRLNNDPLIDFSEGVWRVRDMGGVWAATACGFFDEDLERLSGITVTVLGERDPAFELNEDDRRFASVYGNVRAYSPQLREGLSTTLAILGARPEVLKNCSVSRREAHASRVVRDILQSDEWVDWASINDILPLLAEAAPSEVLSATERASVAVSNPFFELFKQEGRAPFGGPLVSGLLWALETIAWEPDGLGRATLCLGALAEIDPGGNWLNRPSNSLKEIYLPWRIHTRADSTRRHAVVGALVSEHPDAAWDLLLSTLPGTVTFSSGTRKPVWRGSAVDYEEFMPPDRGWGDCLVYAEQLIDLAIRENGRLEELLLSVDKIPPPALERLLDFIESTRAHADRTREAVAWWRALRRICIRHRRHRDADWSMSNERLERLESIIDGLTPSDPEDVYSEYFTSRTWEMSAGDNWHTEIAETRDRAIREVFADRDLERLFAFAKIVESPWFVGQSLARVGLESLDQRQLRSMLSGGQKHIVEVARGYAVAAFESSGLEWLESLSLADWPTNTAASLLTVLPFDQSVWAFIRGDCELERAYWRRANVNPYGTEDHVEEAVEYLIDAKRPHAAIDCLARLLETGRSPSLEVTARVLLDATGSEEPWDVLHECHILSLIAAIQRDSAISSETKCRVESAWLPLLTRDRDGRPISLESELSNDPMFFCDFVRIAYRSTRDEEPRRELGKSEIARAQNAAELLEHWRQIPGDDFEEGFNSEAFRRWIDVAVSELSESGHLEVGLQQIGRVLIHSPTDVSGLWIHKTVASTLNAAEMVQMRRGFCLALYNSRGVYWEDPTGRADLELARGYWEKADALEDTGFPRLATTLRQLGDRYEQESREGLA